MGGAGDHLASGELLWSRDTKTDTSATPPEWGYAGSPLVLGDRVLVVPGGADGFVAAYDRRSGELVGRGGSEEAAYSSPFLATLGGAELIVSLNGRSVTGHDPATLEQRFRHPWSSAQPNVAQPLPHLRMAGQLLHQGRELGEHDVAGDHDMVQLQHRLLIGDRHPVGGARLEDAAEAVVVDGLDAAQLRFNERG